MTAVDRKRLRELALAATPGDWFTVDAPWLPRDTETYIISGHPDPHCGKFVCDFEDCDTLDEDERNHWNNAAFIAAANPQTILALLDALAAEVAALKYDIERHIAIASAEAERA